MGHFYPIFELQKNLLSIIETCFQVLIGLFMYQYWLKEAAHFFCLFFHAFLKKSLVLRTFMFILLVNMMGHNGSYLVNLEKNLLFPRCYSPKC